jgi:hypothetical protein
MSTQRLDLLAFGLPSLSDSQSGVSSINKNVQIADDNHRKRKQHLFITTSTSGHHNKRFFADMGRMCIGQGQSATHLNPSQKARAYERKMMIADRNNTGVDSSSENIP